MDDSIAIKTDLFEHREVKPSFINPCCFGEDFALWLERKLTSLTSRGFAFSEPVQEDYGWGFWVSHGKDRFWVALSYAGDGPQEEPAEWVVSVSKPGFISRLFRRMKSKCAFEDLRNCIWGLLKSESAIQVVEAQYRRFLSQNRQGTQYPESELPSRVQYWSGRVCSALLDRLTLRQVMNKAA